MSNTDPTIPLNAGDEVWLQLENGWTVSVAATTRELRVKTRNRGFRCVATQVIPLEHKSTNPNPIRSFR